MIKDGNYGDELEEKYDLDRDNLSYSHSRADYIHKYCSKKSVKKKQSPLEVLSETNPTELKNFGSGKIFDRIFKKLVNTGYVIKNSYGRPISDFSLLDGSQKWDIYINLMKEFDLLKPR